eukprot:5627931-Prymnesium_polylepis.1
MGVRRFGGPHARFGGRAMRRHALFVLPASYLRCVLCVLASIVSCVRAGLGSSGSSYEFEYMYHHRHTATTASYYYYVFDNLVDEARRQGA